MGNSRNKTLAHFSAIKSQEPHIADKMGAQGHPADRLSHRPSDSRRHLPVGRCLLVCVALVLISRSASTHLAQASEEPTKEVRSTQPSIERQLDTPNLSPVVSSSAATPNHQDRAPATSAAKSGSGELKPAKSKQPSALSLHKKVPSRENYDRYQLKATNSHHSSSGKETGKDSSGQEVANHNNKVKGEANESAASSSDKEAQQEGAKSSSSSESQSSSGSSSSPSSSSSSASSLLGQKKAAAGYNSGVNKGKSSFSLLKKFLPSFMTSGAAGPMAAAAAAAGAAVVDKHQMSHSRSSQSGIPLTGEPGALSKASGRIINLLTTHTKKSLPVMSSGSGSGIGAVPDHAPFFVRKQSIDRQAGFASSLLSNPLSLGLLFSAPLIPSLLLTPLAIAGLSPAMSAINNFFGDDEEASTPAPSPLSVLTGPSSPLSSILQGSSSSSSSPSLALQAVQSFLGPPASTEKPLFNPGMFASQGIQNAAASIQSPSASTSGSSSASNSSPVRNFLGGNLIQTAASMISPSFAAPPSSSGSASATSSGASGDSDDGPGFMQAASDMFDKVASYMNPDSKDTLASSGSSPAASVAQSPLSSLVGLSSYSPFQLSSLLANGPLGSAIAPATNSAGSTSSGSSNSHVGQRAGFFSTLKNVYELFSSSFLRRQEVGDSNECQQRLICEIHQRAMNSKLFRRSVQSNLVELANLDKTLQDQIKNNPMQARVDADTKAMLNDFLKATNNFKSGRELVNCGKMFPKCSRVMLLSAANAHLTDPLIGGGKVGKFSNLMKKMKFKSNQQHQAQWKLRKPSKPDALLQQAPRAPQGMFIQPMDYLQVAPMSPSAPAAGLGKSSSELNPVDSLKLVQQILLMSQQQQQQQQQAPNQPQPQSQVQSQQYPTSVQQAIPAAGNQYQQLSQSQSQQSTPAQVNQQIYQQPMANQMSNSYQYAQYQQSSGAPTNIYTDSMGSSMYASATESPYYMSMQSQQQQPPQHQPQLDFGLPQPGSGAMASQSQQYQHQQSHPTSTSVLPDQYIASAIQPEVGKKNNLGQSKAAVSAPAA